MKPKPPARTSSALTSVKPVSTPFPPIAFDKNTIGGRPVKIPVPPRTWVFASPVTSKLNPKRGSNKYCVSGILPVLKVSLFLNFNAAIAGFSSAVFSKVIAEALMP